MVKHFVYLMVGANPVVTACGIDLTENHQPTAYTVSRDRVSCDACKTCYDNDDTRATYMAHAEHMYAKHYPDVVQWWKDFQAKQS